MLKDRNILLKKKKSTILTISKSLLANLDLYYFLVRIIFRKNYDFTLHGNIF